MSDRIFLLNISAPLWLPVIRLGASFFQSRLPWLKLNMVPALLYGATWIWSAGGVYFFYSNKAPSGIPYLFVFLIGWLLLFSGLLVEILGFSKRNQQETLLRKPSINTAAVDTSSSQNDQESSVHAPGISITKSSYLATWSLIVSTVGLFMIPIVSSILAIVWGHMARRECRKDPTITGSGIALSGLIIGYLGLFYMVGIMAFLNLRHGGGF